VGAGPCFHPKQKRVPCPSRALGERAGLLADIAAVDLRIHAKLLTTTGCPARFNLDRAFFGGWPTPSPCTKAWAAPYHFNQECTLTKTSASTNERSPTPATHLVPIRTVRAWLAEGQQVWHQGFREEVAALRCTRATTYPKSNRALSTA